MAMSCSIRAPSAAWVFITANSSSVSRPGLFRIFDGIVIFPISCSDAALQISGMSLGLILYWSVFPIRLRKSSSVSARIWTTCRPLSPLRNSTILDSISTISLLSFSFFRIWSATICSSSFCLADSIMVLITLRRTVRSSKGLLI